MVHQHVALAHGVEGMVFVQRAAARLEGRELQVGALRQVVDLDDAVEVDRAVDAVDRARGQVEVAQQRVDDRLRAVLGDLQAAPPGGSRG
jgi:hypothetical protein